MNELITYLNDFWENHPMEPKLKGEVLQLLQNTCPILIDYVEMLGKERDRRLNVSTSPHLDKETAPETGAAPEKTDNG